MKSFSEGTKVKDKTSKRWPLWFYLAATVALIVSLVGLLRRPGEERAAVSGSIHAPGAASGMSVKSDARPSQLPDLLRKRPIHGPLTAKEIVDGKLKTFAVSRRKLARALAQRHGVKVPDGVEQFFDGVESGDWARIKSSYDAIKGGDGSASTHSPRPEGIQPLWPAIVDAYGAAEQVHLWQPQQLLDYGNAVMDSLAPGMAYVGGTDSGRWVPELMNESSGETPHIMITQNALVDDGYLDYVNLQYGSQLTTLTSAQAAQATQDYLANYEMRLAHDQQFPDEPPQVLPGESDGVSIGSDGQLQIGGPKSMALVMGINGTLLQALMTQNPGMTFALQESYPFTSTYADAVPLGPIMELGAPGGSAAFTPDIAAQSVNYWNGTAEQLLNDSAAPDSASALNTYAKDAASAANLLASHDYNSEAEEIYRSALQLAPASPDAVLGYVKLLFAQNQFSQAVTAAQAAIAAAPNNELFQSLLVQAKSRMQ